MKNNLKLLVAVISLGFAAQAGAVSSPMPTTKEVVIGIADAFVPGGFDSQTDAYVVVSGIFPNGCYHWKGANVNHKTSHEHLITSIATVTQGMCLQVLLPFTKDVRLGQLESGDHTLKFISNDGTYLEKHLVVE